MVLLGGVYSRIGALELPWVILVGWIGTFLGASFDYTIGRFNDRTWLRRVMEQRHMADALDRAGDLLRRYGPLAFLLGHFVAQIRSLVFVAAGATRLPYWRFALYEAPAALAWTTVYAIGGYFLADQLPLFEQIMKSFGWVVALAIGAFVTWKVWLQPRRRAPEPPGDT
jgi:membrane-associated protein